MVASLEFETPENIKVAYEPAGLGTRYLAWFIDNILISIAIVVMFFLAIMLGAITETAVRETARMIEGAEAHTPTERAERGVMIIQYFIGISILVWGFGSFFYYTFFELLFRGQTIGKWTLGLRVVRVDGFALDPSAIFVRNIFRVIDQFPPCWIAPLMSKRSQRFGDMVAGTTVIADRPEQLSNVRQTLVEMPAADARFTFDSTKLGRARPQDFAAVEKILERWEKLTGDQRNALLDQLVPPLVERLKVDPPAVEERVVFLKDLLAAEYRRQHRNL